MKKIYLILIILAFALISISAYFYLKPYPSFSSVRLESERLQGNLLNAESKSSSDAYTIDLTTGNHIYSENKDGTIIVTDDSGDIATINLELDVAGKTIPFADKDIVKGTIDLKNYNIYNGEFTHNLQVPQDLTSKPILDFTAKYDVVCNRGNVTYSGNTAQCGKILIDFNTLKTEVFTAQFDNNTVTKYDIKPQSYDLVTTKDGIEATLSSKYQTEIDSKKKLTASDMIVLDPTYTISNLTLNSGLSNVKCEAGGLYCHSAINDSSLVLYMPFDVNMTNSSTSELDWSQYNNIGTRVSGAYYNSSGIYGGAMEFDGLDDYVSINNATTTTFINTTAYTWSVWLYLKNSKTFLTINTQIQCFLARDASPKRSGYNFCLNQTRLNVVDGGTYTTTPPVNAWINLNQWTHVAITYDGKGNWTFYVNGTYSDSILRSLSPDASASKYVIGCGELGNSGVVSSFFNGTIDEVMMFNRSLSATEISQIYNQTWSRFKSPANQTIRPTAITNGNNTMYVTTYLNNQKNSTSDLTNLSMKLGQINMSISTSGLYTYMPMEWNISKTQLYDVNNGAVGTATVNTGANWLPTGGVNGTGGYDFQKSIGIQMGLPLNTWTSVSSVFWLKSYDMGSQRWIARGNLGGFYVSKNTKKIRFLIPTTGTDCDVSSTDLTDGLWYQVAVVYDDTIADCWVYLNGYLNATDLGTGTTQVTDTSVFIGGEGGSVNDGVNGTLDEVMFFNRVLSAGEINKLYNDTVTKFNNLHYSAPQNMTNNINVSFPISTNATFIIPYADYFPDQSNFFSPILYGNISMVTLTTSGATPDTTPPIVTVNNPLPYTNISVSNVNFTLTLNENGGTCLASLNNFLYNYTMSGTTTIFNYTNGTIANGLYTANFSCNDTSGNRNSTAWTYFNLTYNAPDTINPNINFTNPTESSGELLERSYILINVTATDTNLANITINIFNSSGIINSTNALTSPNYFNYSTPRDGVYYFNSTATDNSGNKNYTETRNVTIDVTDPAIAYVNPTQSSGVTLARNYVEVNVTGVLNPIDPLDVLTIRLYNITGILNTTSSSSSPFYLKFQNLADGTYYYNATRTSILNGNVDLTTRNITLDNKYPTFSNYWDDNGTLTNSGTGSFRVNVANTNGTVILNINGQKVLAGLTSSQCYQETANVSTACGGLGSGSYRNNSDWQNFPDGYPALWDGSWSTRDLVKNLAGSVGYVWINYTKPSSSLSSSLWQVKDFGSQENLTIPIGCWNYNSNTIQFRISSDKDGLEVNWTCYDGSWNVLKTYAGAYAYEEAMIWNISYYNATYTFSSAGDYTYNWSSYGSGSSNLVNFSDNFIYTVKSGAANTCTYTSGNWVVNCADNCVITSNVALGGNNLILNGTGQATDKFIVIGANITGVNQFIRHGCKRITRGSTIT